MAGNPISKNDGTTINFSAEAIAAAQEIMFRARLLSVEKAIQRALGRELTLTQYEEQGWQVIVQKGRKSRVISFDI